MARAVQKGASAAEPKHARKHLTKPTAASAPPTGGGGGGGGGGAGKTTMRVKVKRAKSSSSSSSSAVALPSAALPKAAAAAAAAPGAKPKRPHRFRQGVRALMDVRAAMLETKRMIPRTRFINLAREISQDCETNSGGIRWTRAALDALQEEFEAYGVKLMESANHLTTEVRRAQVLEVRDMQSAVYLATGNMAYRKGYALFTRHTRLSKSKSKPRRHRHSTTAAAAAAPAAIGGSDSSPAGVAASAVVDAVMHNADAAAAAYVDEDEE